MFLSIETANTEKSVSFPVFFSKRFLFQLPRERDRERYRELVGMINLGLRKKGRFGGKDHSRPHS